MIGSVKMSLSSDDVKQALEEYINRHLRPEHRRAVVAWADNDDGVEVSTITPAAVDLTFGAPSELRQTDAPNDGTMSGRVVENHDVPGVYGRK